MSTAENKKLVQHIFDELGKGNSAPLVESMAEDFCWTITGSTSWSRRYAGKKAVLHELFGALRAVLSPPIITVAERFIADEDYVAVQARGANTTRAGKPLQQQVLLRLPSRGRQIAGSHRISGRRVGYLCARRSHSDSRNRSVRKPAE